MTLEYHLPTRPYTPIDALNRHAAAVGSPGRAGAALADYNGHHVAVRYNDFRGYYVAEYWWAGRVVLARGSLAHCLGAAVREHDRGAVGASVSCFVQPEDAGAPELQADIVAGSEPATPEWYTWKHRCAAESVKDMANPEALVRIFDWNLMQIAVTEADYDAAVEVKYGRIWR